MAQQRTLTSPVAEDPVGTRPKVLYIAGWGRSGSTLLDQILGELEGWFSCGELRFAFWNLVCGCGVPVHQCEFWAPVFARTLGQDVSGRSEELGRIQVAHLGASPAELLAIRRAKPGSPHQRYADALARLYTEIGEQSGARVVVDSTKLATDAYLVSMLTDVDLYVIHLVRDPRATAHSWSRAKLKDPSDPESHLGRLSPARSSAYWLRRNAVIDLLLRPRLGDRYMRLRYEDFMADPQAAVGSILSLVGEPEWRTPFVAEREVDLAMNHTVAGNPRRFATGRVEIRHDSEWRTSLRGRSRLMATLPALALMRRYGYSLRA